MKFVVHCSVLVLFMLTVLGCSQSERDSTDKPVMLLYTGMTMANAISELAEKFSERENCEIIVSKGSSGTMLKAIEANQYGDIFFGGNEKYIKEMEELGLTDYYQHVGYNLAVLMVQKGNPLNIKSDLSVLANPNYYIILGNPESGAIGKEAKMLLENKGIYDEVLLNTRGFTPDSKYLIEAVAAGEADVVLNWYASIYTYHYEEEVTVLQLPVEEVPPNKLLLSRLVYSEYPELAKEFIDFTLTEEGQEVFAKYGLSLDIIKN